MKILTAAQLSEADKVTLEKQEITSEELMERAGTLVFNEIHKRLQGAPIPIKIFCGIGNNGGDGLVVARHLIQHGYEVRTFIVNYSDERSEDFLSNYEKLKEITNDWPELIKSKNGFPEIHTGDFVIVINAEKVRFTGNKLAKRGWWGRVWSRVTKLSCCGGWKTQ